MRPRLAGPLIGPRIGLLSVGVSVGVGELAAALFRPAASPIIAVGNRFVLLTPESVKRTVIKQVGTNDKTVLLLGIYLVIAALAVVIGSVSVRRQLVGLAGIAFFGLVGCWAALTSNAHRTSDAVPSIAAAIAGMLTLHWLLTRQANPPVISKSWTDRRTFLQLGLAAAALAAGFGGRALQHRRFDATAARAATVLPPTEPSATASSVNGPFGQPGSSGETGSSGPANSTAAFDLQQGGVPFQTASAGFYRIDTALAVPQIDPKTWHLRIHGKVAKELRISYAELLARPLIERWVTLCCVSNEVGGELIGTALFKGVRLADLLREAGVVPGADQLVASSSDGMTIGSPTAVVMDGRDAMLAVGMNGEVLPIEHGFPVRMVVPGLYGYVSACKWIVDIEVTTFDAVHPYWVTAGWAEQAPVLLSSRIDTPKTGKSLVVGSTVAIAGIAWDQHVGVSKVEVQVNDGAWTRARLAQVPSTDTWRQWVLPWQVGSKGKHQITVRAYDTAGAVQVSKTQDPFPSGATGYHSITVTAS